MKFYLTQLAFERPVQLVVKESPQNVSLGILEEGSNKFPPVAIFFDKADFDRVKRACDAFNAIMAENKPAAPAKPSPAAAAPAAPQSTGPQAKKANKKTYLS